MYDQQQNASDARIPLLNPYEAVQKLTNWKERIH